MRKVLHTCMADLDWESSLCTYPVLQCLCLGLENHENIVSLFYYK